MEFSRVSHHVISTSVEISSRTYFLVSSSLLKKTHMLRCRSIVSLQRTGSTPPLVDFSRASPLDLFEQPARGFFFQHPASLEQGIYQVTKTIVWHSEEDVLGAVVRHLS